APAITVGTAASTARRATRRSSTPARRYCRAPTTADGSTAGSGDAIAIGAGTPSSTRIGVPNADPPAPNRPKAKPMPMPATTTGGRDITAMSRLGGAEVQDVEVVNYISFPYGSPTAAPVPRGGGGRRHDPRGRG